MQWFEKRATTSRTPLPERVSRLEGAVAALLVMAGKDPFIVLDKKED